jgi:alpha-glucosidase
MRAVACAILVTMCLAGVASAEEWPVASPDGRTTLVVSLGPGGRLTWRVAHGGAPILAESPLGIRRDDEAFTEGLKVISASTVSSVDERYQMPHGKRKDHHVRGRQRTLAFANANGARLELVLRVQDEGVAFRYRFPAPASSASGAAGTKRVLDELTGFHVPEGSRGWMLPQSPPGRYTPAYEDYFAEVTAGRAAPGPSGWAYPALFNTGRAWLLITEAGLDGEYCGSRLASEAPGGVYRLRFPEEQEGRGVGDVQPSSTLPWTMPWRVVIVADTAGGMLESDLVLDLSAPSRLTDTSWIRPGRASWSWWSQSDSPRHAEALNRFVDLAAEMTWEYSLVDANWNLMQSGTIDDVIAHARSKQVGLLFWYNSGGPHNDVTEAPRDRMYTRDARRAEFARLSAWGVKGVKVDFWHSDKQDRIRQYREVLEDAADFRLLVNFHGCTVPRGWSREFPHLVAMEGVLGAEQYKFNDTFAARAPSHNTILPFTRNAVGPMDYTPVTFSNSRHPHLTTNAHELALSVVFESGVQHFADSVDGYRTLPEAPRTFLQQVPTAWDDTRALAGEPGRLVLVARRKVDAWYVGGVNGREDGQTVRVDLSFLGQGTWSATIIRDGADDRAFTDETRTVTSRDSVPVATRARGGFVMRVVRRGR